VRSQAHKDNTDGWPQVLDAFKRRVESM
jgi:hypothetical protein